MYSNSPENIAMWFALFVKILLCDLHFFFSPIKTWRLSLKAVDTIGNRQNPVFSFGVSQHVHKITNLWKFELNWSSELRDNYERKNTLVTRSCVLSDAWFRDLKFSTWGLEIKFLLYWKLHHFRGSLFSQGFILLTSPYYYLQIKGLC